MFFCVISEELSVMLLPRQKCYWTYYCVHDNVSSLIAKCILSWTLEFATNGELLFVCTAGG